MEGIYYEISGDSLRSLPRTPKTVSSIPFLFSRPFSMLNESNGSLMPSQESSRAADAFEYIVWKVSFLTLVLHFRIAAKEY
jgi:hypothetical protein